MKVSYNFSIEKKSLYLDHFHNIASMITLTAFLLSYFSFELKNFCNWKYFRHVILFFVKCIYIYFSNVKKKKKYSDEKYIYMKKQHNLYLFSKTLYLLKQQFVKRDKNSLKNSIVTPENRVELNKCLTGDENTGKSVKNAT